MWQINMLPTSLFKIIELLPKDCFFYFCFLLGTFHNLDFCLNTKLRWRRSVTSVLTQKGDITLNNFISLRALSSFSLYLLLHSMLPQIWGFKQPFFPFFSLVLVVDGLGWLVPFGPCRLAVFWQLSLELPEGFFPPVTAAGAGGSPVTVPRLAWVFSISRHRDASRDLPLLWKGQLPFGFPCCHVDIHSLLIFWFPKRGWNSNS